MKTGNPQKYGTILSWDLKSARDVDQVGDVGRQYQLHWTGDLDGDGIGDFIAVTRGKSRLRDYVHGTLQWKGGYKDRPIPYKIFDVRIGCGAIGGFHRLWNEQTNRAPYYRDAGTGEPDFPLDRFDISGEEKTGSDIPSVCIESPPMHVEAPPYCLDLGRWESVARSPGR